VVQHYIIGVGAFLLLSVAWLGVQRAWRKSFADVTDEPDALAGRARCHGCSGSADCQRKGINQACEAQEKRP
jgi:hypothetical protein